MTELILGTLTLWALGSMVVSIFHSVRDVRLARIKSAHDEQVAKLSHQNELLGMSLSQCEWQLRAVNGATARPGWMARDRSAKWLN